MRGIRHDRAGHAAIHLSHQCHPPGDRAAPVVSDHGKALDPQRIGEQENVAHQLIGGVILHRGRFGRAAIAALVGRDAAEVLGEMCDLMPPCAVALGKAVEEDQHRCIARPFVHHIEFDPVGECDAGLFHH